MIRIVLDAKFDKETKRTLRYQLEHKGGISGSIYVQKDQVPTPHPTTIRLTVEKP
jgi:hypothetical protein